MKLSFKKEKAQTGLARIGAGNSPIAIKADKLKVGYINFPNWSSKTNTIDIRFAVHPDGYETWKWITLAHHPINEEDARQFIEDNWTKIITKYKLHQFED
jgi:hypothetical protein